MSEQRSAVEAPLTDPLVPFPEVGRTFTVERRVRLGDVTADGRLRLDAVARYCQDTSNDDTRDVDLPDAMAWVVRRTVIDVRRPGHWDEVLSVTTWAGGLGRRWAERRLRLLGVPDAARSRDMPAEGAVRPSAHLEVSTLWIHLDPMSGRPKGLSETFLEHYGPSAGERTVAARRVLPNEVDATARHLPWPVRRADLDTLGHVNNTNYLAVVEEFLPDGWADGPLRVVVDYAAGVPAGADLEIAVAETPTQVDLWWLVGGDVVAAARITPGSPTP